jgi:hypothetical protein
MLRMKKSLKMKTYNLMPSWTPLMEFLSGIKPPPKA